MDGATLNVSLHFDHYGLESAGFSTKLHRVVVEHMRPVDVCSDATFALLSNGNVVTELQYEREVKVDRERLAKMLAEQVTASLMEYMESRDTKNGYRKDPK